MSIYLGSKRGLADVTLMYIHEKQVRTIQEGYKVNLKEHAANNVWLLLILSSSIYPVNANCFK